MSGNAYHNALFCSKLLKFISYENSRSFKGNLKSFFMFLTVIYPECLKFGDYICPLMEKFKTV